MKIILINGSARDNGSCSFILDKIADAFDTNSSEIVKYNIANMNIHYCIGCKSCYENGKCVHNDDVAMIVKDILSSDYVMIAVPSYWADVPAQMKTFIDRNTPFGDTNENRILKAEKEIKGIAIAVRAGKTEKENEKILDSVDHYYGHLGIKPIKRFSVTEVNDLNDLKKKEEIIKKIHHYITKIKGQF